LSGIWHLMYGICGHWQISFPTSDSDLISARESWDVSGQPFPEATLRSQPTLAIEHAGIRSHYIWEGKCHPILLSESLWEIMGIDLAVANSHFFVHRAVVLLSWYPTRPFVASRALMYDA